MIVVNRFEMFAHAYNRGVAKGGKDTVANLGGQCAGRVSVGLPEKFAWHGCRRFSQEVKNISGATGGQGLSHDSRNIKTFGESAEYLHWRVSMMTPTVKGYKYTTRTIGEKSTSSRGGKVPVVLSACVIQEEFREIIVFWDEIPLVVKICGCSIDCFSFFREVVHVK